MTEKELLNYVSEQNGEIGAIQKDIEKLEFLKKEYRSNIVEACRKFAEEHAPYKIGERVKINESTFGPMTDEGFKRMFTTRWVIIDDICPTINCDHTDKVFFRYVFRKIRDNGEPSKHLYCGGKKYSEDKIIK